MKSHPLTGTSVVAIIKQTFTEFSRDNCSRMAAAMAYFTSLSLAPLMLLIITLCGLVWDTSEVRGTMTTEISRVVGEAGAEQIRTMLENAGQDKRGWLSSVISLVMLIVGATGLVGQLQGALNDAWGVQPDPSQGGVTNFLVKRLLSFAMICGIAFLLLVSLVASTVLAVAGSRVTAWLPPGMSQTLLACLHQLISFIVIALLFAVMFKVLPDADVAWSDVAVGSGLTAVLFLAGQMGLGFYLSNRDIESSYGEAGSLMLLLIWVYYSAMILLLGAEFTQVWSRQRGYGGRPSPGAVMVEQNPVVVERTQVQQDS